MVSIDAGLRNIGVVCCELAWVAPAEPQDVPDLSNVQLVSRPVFLHNATGVAADEKVNDLTDDELASRVAAFVSEHIQPLLRGVQFLVLESPDKNCNLHDPRVRFSIENKIFVRIITAVFGACVRLAAPSVTVISFPSVYKCKYVDAAGYLPSDIPGLCSRSVTALHRQAQRTEFPNTGERRKHLKAVSTLHTHRILNDAGYGKLAERVITSDNAHDSSDAFMQAVSWFALSCNKPRGNKKPNVWRELYLDVRKQPVPTPTDTVDLVDLVDAAAVNTKKRKRFLLNGLLSPPVP